MNWYYVEGGQQAGPVDDAQFEALVRNGRIEAECLVWHEGMPNWQPLHYVRSTPFGGGSQVPGPPMPASDPSQAKCAECGGVFNREDLLAFGEIHVCAACKPVFMQKLSEGAKIETGARRYAGFWIRAGAKMVDGLILRVVGFVLMLAVGIPLGAIRPSGAAGIEVFGLVFGSLVAMAYYVFFVGKYGATPGKMACKLKIVTAHGEPMSYSKAFGRFWAEAVSGCLTLTLGYIMAGFDKEARALHDRICDTRVIYK
jgi:uncharacterized RDD family membrane protein YckC